MSDFVDLRHIKVVVAERILVNFLIENKLNRHRIKQTNIYV